jgi:hypothetical protein
MQMNAVGRFAMLGLMTVTTAGCAEMESASEGEPLEGAASEYDSQVTSFSAQPFSEQGGGGGNLATIFRSSLGRGGSGAIRDLKFEKGNSSAQTPLAGYHLITADLNRGAGGAYIYLTFTRDLDSIQNGDECGHISNDFVTGIVADDYNAFDAVGAKGNCSFRAPGSPILQPIRIGSSVLAWKHPDLNDGSGGRFIFAWQYKQEGGSPIHEVGVVSGGSSGIQCPTGWIKQTQDLNQGAGGDYIYFCYRH